jgi:hypothetical protein
MSRHQDPTKTEMLQAIYENFSPDLRNPNQTDFDIEEAIFWFANDYHGGQNSNLYEVLCNSPYEPGPNVAGPQGVDSADIYDFLVETFAEWDYVSKSTLDNLRDI